MRNPSRHWLMGLVLLLLATTAGAGELTVEDPRLRLMPGDVPAAGYFRLRNGGDAPAVLTGAESAAFARVMLHESRLEDGMAHMAPVSALTVAPGETVAFAPGGYHLMLRGRKTPLEVGDEVAVTLRFEGGRRLPVIFRAESPLAR